MVSCWLKTFQTQFAWWLFYCASSKATEYWVFLNTMMSLFMTSNIIIGLFQCLELINVSCKLRLIWKLIILTDPSSHRCAYSGHSYTLSDTWKLPSITTVWSTCQLEVEFLAKEDLSSSNLHLSVNMLLDISEHKQHFQHFLLETLKMV